MKILIGRKVYYDSQQTLEGFLARPKESLPYKKPCVVIFHTFMGLTDFEIKRAKFLARYGLVAFCADIYGKHIKNVTAEEGNNCARVYFGNRNTLLRSRLNAAIKYVTSLEFVDRERMGAIGFGFGGMSVLDAARHNLGLKCAVVFNGQLSPITDYANVERIQTKLLVCYGDMNSNSDKEVESLLQELRERRADFQFIRYSKANDDFADDSITTPEASNFTNIDGVDKRSSQSMLALFSQTFGVPKFSSMSR